MMSVRREYLKIVFHLKAEKDHKSIKTLGGVLEKINPVVDSKGISGVKVLQHVFEIMEKLGMVRDFTAHGEPISHKNLEKQVMENPFWPSGIVSNEISFRYSLVTAREHSFFLMEELKPDAAKSWKEWINPFLDEGDFVQAWVADKDYDHWQNAEDPLQYTAVGREYRHLPMKSNGLPPPLTKDIIDTSKNPGRWVLKRGYVEAVGTTMWLGERFWQCIGEDRKAAILSADWLEVRPVTDGVLLVKAAERCFCDESTAPIQERLRTVLYGVEPAE